MAAGSTLISHEWLAQHGGSENVFEQLLAAVPGSSPHCLWNDAPTRFGAEVTETWLARTPLRHSKALSLPFHGAAWHSVDLRDVDRVIASSHAFGHHLATRAASRGIAAFAYVHTPARYVWVPALDHRGGRRAARCAAAVLRRSDRRKASPAVNYAANSQFVRERIRDAWAMDARVIYPPVAVERIQATESWSHVLSDREQDSLHNLPENFVLGASRLVEYKRLDLAIKVGALVGLPVVIAGDGPHRDRLVEQARENSVDVTFVGRVSDEFLYALYQRATLFVFMAVEDFGIMPVEAMAAGTPVLANVQGGAAESVGLTRAGLTVEVGASDRDLRASALAAISLAPDVVREGARQFGESAFRARVRSWIDEDDDESTGHLS